jgi:dephospho-CoA kinase
MLKIGLTGGIGSGKSSTTQLFSSFNVPIIDADVIAWQLTQPHKAALKSIKEHFGDETINPDGELNRNKLRAIIFSEPEKKQQLENLLHPLIYAEIARQINQLNTAYCIVSIPLLVETYKISSIKLDRILVIDCPVELQIQRVKDRSQLSDVQIHAIIAAQSSREQRIAYADDIIDNSKSATHLAEQVKKLHNSYFLLSSA